MKISKRLGLLDIVLGLQDQRGEESIRKAQRGREMAFECTPRDEQRGTRNTSSLVWENERIRELNVLVHSTWSS